MLMSSPGTSAVHAFLHFVQADKRQALLWQEELKTAQAEKQLLDKALNNFAIRHTCAPSRGFSSAPTPVSLPHAAYILNCYVASNNYSYCLSADGTYVHHDMRVMMQQWLARLPVTLQTFSPLGH